MATQARGDARVYTPERDGALQPFRGTITGDPMGGNVTPRFGMDTDRQRSTNLGLPPAKRKVVKTVSADPAVADKVITTVEDEVPSQDDVLMRQFQQHKDADTVPSSGMFVQSAQAGPLPGRTPTAQEAGPEPRKDPEGNWWFWDTLKSMWVKGMQSIGGLGRTSVGELIVGPDLQPTEAGRDVQQALTETTAQRNARVAGVQPDPTGTGDTGGDPTLPATRTAVAGLPPSNFQQGDVTSRIYDNWSRDIPTERKEYIRAMKDIYFKMSMLSAVASLTGGEDQSEGFGRIQVEMLNYMMETDNQERLLKIHKGVYFNKDGKWDPPKNERMTHQRAVRFGAGPAEASEISGYYPKKEGIFQNWRVTEKATDRFTVIASQGRPEGYDPELFEFRIETAGFGKDIFNTYKVQFDAAPNDDARKSVARRYARALKKQSGMPIVQAITDAEMLRAYEELQAGKEYEVEDMSGPQD